MNDRDQAGANDNDGSKMDSPSGQDELFERDEGAFEAQWVDCDYCNAELELSGEELSQGWYICPECGQLSHLSELSGEGVDPVLEFPARAGDAQWIQLATVAGFEEASLIISYLRANGIEAYAWQEGAGRALGLSVGALGASHIMIREDQVQLARSLLEAEVEGDLGGDEPDDESLAESSKAVMGLTAITISPLGAGIAYGLARILGRHDEGDQDNLVECVHCGTALELTDQEVAQGWYACPECQQTVELNAYVICPSCLSELALDEIERIQGWYRCPECDQVTQL